MYILSSRSFMRTAISCQTRPRTETVLLRPSPQRDDVAEEEPDRGSCLHFRQCALCSTWPLRFLTDWHDRAQLLLHYSGVPVLLTLEHNRSPLASTESTSCQVSPQAIRSKGGDIRSRAAALFDQRPHRKNDVSSGRYTPSTSSTVSLSLARSPLAVETTSPHSIHCCSNRSNFVFADSDLPQISADQARRPCLGHSDCRLCRLISAKVGRTYLAFIPAVMSLSRLLNKDDAPTGPSRVVAPPRVPTVASPFSTPAQAQAPIAPNGDPARRTAHMVPPSAWTEEDAARSLSLLANAGASSFAFPSNGGRTIHSAASLRSTSPLTTYKVPERRRDSQNDVVMDDTDDSDDDDGPSAAFQARAHTSTPRTSIADLTSQRPGAISVNPAYASTSTRGPLSNGRPSGSNGRARKSSRSASAKDYAEAMPAYVEPETADDESMADSFTSGMSAVKAGKAKAPRKRKEKPGAATSPAKAPEEPEIVEESTLDLDSLVQQQSDLITRQDIWQPALQTYIESLRANELALIDGFNRRENKFAYETALRVMTQAASTLDAHEGRAPETVITDDDLIAYAHTWQDRPPTGSGVEAFNLRQRFPYPDVRETPEPQEAASALLLLANEATRPAATERIPSEVKPKPSQLVQDAHAPAHLTESDAFLAHQLAAEEAALAEDGSSRRRTSRGMTSRQDALALDTDKDYRAPRNRSKTSRDAATQRWSSIQSAEDTVWSQIAKVHLPRAYRMQQAGAASRVLFARRISTVTTREARRFLNRTRAPKELQIKGKRVSREVLTFWRGNEKRDRDDRRTAAREVELKIKKEEEARESKRQARKLNFLITQTELYSHFVGDKLNTSAAEESAETEPAAQVIAPGAIAELKDTPMADAETGELNFDDDDDAALHAQARRNAQEAVNAAKLRAQAFDEAASARVGPKVPTNALDFDADDLNFQNPSSLGDNLTAQPTILTAQLKPYQIKGLTWLGNLYEQGINGILADEMGLGKTVQSISLMAYLAETHNIWGPFLVIAPASTLHNWQQELTRFVPTMKTIPYWGSVKDRTILRKIWNRRGQRFDRDSAFHIVVTSYQLVVQDITYFQQLKWQYMILDEAQAIKSSSSARWKALLGLPCRNRLLLTGTPIQNSMQELWALLHFIMPSLFDSHDEFSEWFSKGIESKSEDDGKMNEHQLRRLHMILKPFMLRRIKKNVQNELADKIEVDVYCDLTPRQRAMYKILRENMHMSDLLKRATSLKEDDDSAKRLLNLIMQMRKLCNHPELFQRADVTGSWSFCSFNSTLSLMRDPDTLVVPYAATSPIKYRLPKLLYRQPTPEGAEVPIRPHDEADHLSRLFNLRRPAAVSMERMDIEYAADRIETGLKTIILEKAHTSRLAQSDMQFYIPAVSAPPVEIFCPDQSFVIDQSQMLFNPKLRTMLYGCQGPSENDTAAIETLKWRQPLLSPAGLLSELPNIQRPRPPMEVPQLAKLILESGKLARLDTLLQELKAGGHRVLIYFQMTRMIDLMEEYLAFRQHKYLRLDGNSDISERRDLVIDWQTRPDLFIFLLSTRAGGLGINLTSADTVIFYDSDWNPSNDAQAMDRAHRIGQTKQVTIYRLITKGTVEERILNLARAKKDVQDAVVGSSTQHVDVPKQSEVVSLLLEEEEGISRVATADRGTRTSNFNNWSNEDDEDAMGFFSAAKNNGMATEDAEDDIDIAKASEAPSGAKRQKTGKSRSGKSDAVQRQRAPKGEGTRIRKRKPATETPSVHQSTGTSTPDDHTSTASASVIAF
ncbi:uncharacterized protein L969DRAFT_91363 [Mixia osmundae IAM 14324]|uniref:uncharacterized protein n=1 Tax=Mixia osmundae (strain CBS 9802 / IAM 14324 / JCM 22182 / KY 12970) TaxID=764103 RepID=UPI0004A54888|nr:uncharacterized protein L969DRAFT_91363 [Mixia osmundae IAM 14324]KEI41892.1 hypothetical protein L969DRAFT_91363 [Mixia osmundae IAM 14324]